MGRCVDIKRRPQRRQHMHRAGLLAGLFCIFGDRFLWVQRQ